MDKKNKIFIGIGILILLTSVSAYAYNKSKNNKKSNTKKQPETKDKSTEIKKEEPKTELATKTEATELIVKAINNSKRENKQNWLSELAGTDTKKRNDFYNKFKEKAVTIPEYNATAKFLDTYYKSDKVTLDLMTKEERDLVMSLFNKLHS